jgi:hypothetical protein
MVGGRQLAEGPADLVAPTVVCGLACSGRPNGSAALVSYGRIHRSATPTPPCCADAVRALGQPTYCERRFQWRVVSQRQYGCSSPGSSTNLVTVGWPPSWSL